MVVGKGWEEPPPAARGVGGVKREQVTPLTAQVGVSPVVGHTPTAHLDKNKGKREISERNRERRGERVRDKERACEKERMTKRKREV